MIEAKPPTTVHKEPELTEICVRGHLDKQWCDWFMGLTITHCENGDTRLTGLVPDQSALYGLLKKIRDLGIPLLSVNRVKASPATISGLTGRSGEPAVIRLL